MHDESVAMLPVNDGLADRKGRIRALVITYGFPPISHSGVFRTAAFVKYLPQSEIDPVVFTAEDCDEAIPDQWKYPRSPALGCVNIVRARWEYQQSPLSNRYARWIATRTPVLNALYRKARRCRFVDALLPIVKQVAEEHDVNLIFASSGPPESLLLAQALAHAIGRPFISDLRDPWVYGWNALYTSYIDFWMEHRAEQAVLQDSAFVIANTPTARKQLLQVYRLTPTKVVVIPNGYDEDDFEPAATEPRYFEENHFNLVYTGFFTSSHNGRASALTGLFNYAPIKHEERTRSPLIIMRALEIAGAREHGFRKQVRFHIVGPLAAGVTSELARSPAFPNLVLHGATSARVANALCAQADLVVLLQITMFFQGVPYSTAVPGKLFNYLRSGTRIFAPLQDGDAAQIIRDSAAGTVVDPNDEEAIAEALLTEYHNWTRGTSPRKPSYDDVPVVRQFARDRLTSHLARLMKACAMGRP